MLATAHPPAPPPVYVAEDEFDQLSQIAAAAASAAAGLLRAELARAVVVAAEGEPRCFARLSSEVEYEDLTSGKVRTVELARPEAADLDEGRISVLSPVGAALLGLTPGATFSWTTEDGRPRLLRVRRVAGRARAG